jgi:hypothetical protein
MTDDSRNLALAFWFRSKEFLEAANLIAEAAGGRVSLPAYYLWGHSIELSLKAFLIGRNAPLRELKKKISVITSWLSGRKPRPSALNRRCIFTPKKSVPYLF